MAVLALVLALKSQNLERGVDFDMGTPQDSFRNLAYLAGKKAISKETKSR